MLGVVWAKLPCLTNFQRAGATTPKLIADKSGVESGSVGKYLSTLSGLGIVEKMVPFGDGLRSRRGIYRIADPFFAFWYRFVSPHIGAIETGAGEAVAQMAAGQALSTYVGKQFETVCLQWLMRQNKKGNLPFLASSFGGWWGTDPSEQEQVDIDVIAADTQSKAIVLGECKWRESFDETKALDTLMHRGTLLSGFDEHVCILFMKKSPSSATLTKAANRKDVRVVSAAQLYE